jgi:hypothetical protein
MTLRDRTPEDPPVVDYDVLKRKIELLASHCSGLHYDTRYLPHTPIIDEAYKAHRTLMRVEDVDRALDLARQLEDAIRLIVLSTEHVVKAPEDLAWEAEKQARNLP